MGKNYYGICFLLLCCVLMLLIAKWEDFSVYIWMAYHVVVVVVSFRCIFMSSNCYILTFLGTTVTVIDSLLAF